MNIDRHDPDIVTHNPCIKSNAKKGELWYNMTVNYIILMLDLLSIIIHQC